MNKLLIYIIIFTAIFLGICIMIWKKKRLKLSGQSIFELSITFYTTFIGVFLGVYINDLNVKNKETNQLISILQSVSKDIEVSKEDIIHTWYKRNTFKSYEEKSAFMKNAYTEPLSLNIILEKDFLIQNINPETWNLLLLRNNDVSKTIKKTIIEHSDYHFTHSTYLKIAYDELTNMQKLISTEIDFQKGNLSKANLIDLVNQIDLEKRSVGRIYMGDEQFKKDSLILDQWTKQLQEKKTIY